MTQLVTFYRVDLERGITVEERPSGFYRGNPEYGRTVFKNLRRAKAAFAERSKGEIDRLKRLQRSVKPLQKIDELKANAFSPFDRAPKVERFVTITEAEKILTVSRSTVERMLKEGRLRRFNLGRLIRIPIEDVHRLRNELIVKA